MTRFRASGSSGSSETITVYPLRLEDFTFLTEKCRRIASLICDSHMPHIMPSIFSVVVTIQADSFHSVPLRASTISIFLFLRETIRLTSSDMPTVSKIASAIERMLTVIFISYSPASAMSR